MIDSSSTSVQRKPRVRKKRQFLASVCGICGSVFEPRVAHFHFVSQKRISDRIKKCHPRWIVSDEACPPCVESALKPRRILPFALFPRLVRG